MHDKMPWKYLISDFHPAQKCISIVNMQRAQERGATAVEYGLFVALIAAVIVVGVTALGQSTIGLFQPVSNFFASLPH
jgi:pilus assembly protein Flp/PilA